MAKKILLVEDEAILALSESKILERHGYEVVSAYSGEKALEIVDTNEDISLVLMDIDLGKGIDGTEASRRILEKRELPIVFLTSHSEKEFVDRVKEISSYGYVLKNSGEFVLIESISMAFELFETNALLRRENTERKRTEHQMLKVNTNLQATLDALPDMLFEIDQTGIIHGFHSKEHNEPYADPKKFLGKRYQDILPKSAVEIIDQGLQQAHQSKRVFGIEYPLVHEENERWYQASIAAKREPVTDELRFIFLVRDITEQKRLKEAMEKSEEKYRMLYENAPLPYQSLDKDGRFLDVNPAWLGALGGYKRKEILGRSFADFIHPDSMGDFRRNLEEFKKKGEAKGNIYRMRKRSGEYIDVAFQGRSSYSENGTFQRTHCVFEDITSKRRSVDPYWGNMLGYKEAKRREIFYRSLMENSIDAVYLLSEGGKVLDVNQRACEMLGYTRDELLELTIDDIDVNYPSKKFIAFWNTKPEGSTILFESTHLHKGGFTVPVEVNGIFFIYDGVKYLYGVARDVTERKRAEEAIKEKSELLQNITDNMFDLVSLTDVSGNFTFVGKSHRILGYHTDDLIGTNVLDYVHPEDLPPIKAEFEDFITHAKDGKRVEYRYRCADGNYIWLETVGKTLKDEYGNIREILFSSRDISEKKNFMISLQENEEQLRRIMDSINDGIVVLDTDFKVVRTNRKLREDIGVKNESQLLGKKCYEAFHGFDEECPWCPSKSVVESGGEHSATVPFPSENPQRWFHLLASPVYDGKGNITHVVESARDITSRMKTEQEKDELMRELNHRVKNNLLMISSLVRLKNDSLPPDVDLSDIDRQITAIRLIHEKLYKTEDVSHVDMKEYIEEILAAVFSFQRGGVETVIDVEHFQLDSKTAVAVGLIVNEIATNAVKHGFAATGEARFSARMYREASRDEYVLSLSNTGSSFPEDVHVQKAETLGLRLINSLVGQLDGSIELQRDPVTTFIIRFPQLSMQG